MPDQHSKEATILCGQTTGYQIACVPLEECVCFAKGMTHPPFLGPGVVREFVVSCTLKEGPSITRKRYMEEQIAFAIRQHESGTAVAEIVRKMGISEQTFYRWNKPLV